MILILRLLPNQHCSGCGAAGYAEQKSLLCCYCFGLALAVADRKRKLDLTLSEKFSRRIRVEFLKRKIREPLSEFKP